MPVLVARLQFAFQTHLEGAAGFAKVVQQGCQGGQQIDVFAGVPIVFILTAQDVARGGIGGHGAQAVEATGITHDPKQLTVVQPAYPVTGHGGVFAGGLTQQLA